MSTKMKSLQDAAQASVAAARAIAEPVSAAGREMTASERSAYEGHMKSGRELLSRMQALKSDETILAAAESLADEVGPLAKTPLGSLRTGTHVSGSAWAAKAAARVSSTAQQFGVKALISGSVDVPNVVQPGVVEMPDNPSRLIDLIVNRAELSEGREFSFLRQILRDSKAAPVADGNLKPTSTFTFENVEDRARVVAHLSEPIPERYFADHKGMVDVLESEMFRGVLAAVEAQVIAGDGEGENMTGILETSGIVTVPFAIDTFTTIRKARTRMQLLEEAPTAWVFNPTDAEALDLTVDLEGRYAVTTSSLDNIFGKIPRVVSASVPAGTALLADWNQCGLVVREDIKLDADRSGENFTKNLVTLRAEGRFGFAVNRPQAFAVVDLAA